jgi:pyridoxal phosphate enzyme (YggS family)
VSGRLDPEILADAEARLKGVHARIGRACQAAGRMSSEVTLVGACKRQPIDRIAALVCAGLAQLGENYVQSARTTQSELSRRLDEHFGGGAVPAPGWRMIGHLQRNKASQAVEIFGAVDTLDSGRLARALAGRAQEAGVVLDICLQVNLSGETSKSGCAEADLGDLLAQCAALPGLRVVGLMTLPAPGSSPEAARPAFARLRALRDTLSREPGGTGLHHLNMGMSGDLEVAIDEGATLVRVGTDLFGERPPGSLVPAT